MGPQRDHTLRRSVAARALPNLEIETTGVQGSRLPVLVLSYHLEHRPPERRIRARERFLQLEVVVVRSCNKLYVFAGFPHSVGKSQDCRMNSGVSIVPYITTSGA